jgi:hypothetical protein
MHSHYSFVAEIARQRQADYAAEAAARRRHRAPRRIGWWRRLFVTGRPVWRRAAGALQAASGT